MADLAYVTTAPCGCVQQVVMIDDADPRDLRHHADVLATYNSGTVRMARMTAEEARKMAYRCSAHKAERAAAKGGE